MNEADKLKQRLQALFEQQRLGVLSTRGRQEPYCSLVAFAVTEDLRRIAFATPRGTRKHDNLQAYPRVSMLIDNRSNQATDFMEAMAVTALGPVREARKSRTSRLYQLYQAKHPELKQFVSSPTCAFLCIDVEHYYAVDQFQHVMELHL